MRDIRYLLIENLEGELHNIDSEREDPEFVRWVAEKEMTNEEVEKMFEDMMVKNSFSNTRK